MSDQNQPNFRLCEVPEKRCSSCKNVLMDAEERAFCLNGQGEGANAEQGRQVNANFVCDAYAAK